jgi:hypothetical protein
MALVNLFLPDGEGTGLVAVRWGPASVRVLILVASIKPGLQGRIADVGSDGVLNKTAALMEIASRWRVWGQGGVASPAAGRPAKFPNLVHLGGARPVWPPSCRGMDARAQPAPIRPRDTTVRVLVAFEDAHGAYGEAITRVLGSLRPVLEVRRALLAEIGRELRGFDPHVVICSRTGDGHLGGRGA